MNWPSRGLVAAALFSAAAARAEPSVRPYGMLSSRAAVDTRFDSVPGAPLEENVFDLRERLRAGLDAQLTDRYRLVLEVRALHRFMEQRASGDIPFLVANGRNGRALTEVEAGEAYLDVYTSKVDFRLGKQLFAWGANAAFAPADALNPSDLRMSPLSADPAETKLPVLAASARGEAGPVSIQAAWVPFFEPSRYAVFGSDEAILQPALAALFPDPSLFVDPSLVDAVQPFAAATTLPQPTLFSGDAALRITSERLGPKLGLTYLYSREKLPRVSMDAQAALLMLDATQGRPVDPEVVARLAQRVRSGEKLMQGWFPRYQLIAADASQLLGPVQLDVDVAFSPARTYYTQALSPLFRKNLTGVVGLSDARGTGLIASVNWITQVIPGMQQGERLFLLEPEGAEKQARAAVLNSVAVVLGSTALDGQLSGDLRGMLELSQYSFVVGPRVGWRFNDLVSASLGAELYAGSPLSLFGYFRRNGAVFSEVKLSL